MDDVQILDIGTDSEDELEEDFELRIANRSIREEAAKRAAQTDSDDEDAKELQRKMQRLKDVAKRIEKVRQQEKEKEAEENAEEDDDMSPDFLPLSDSEDEDEDENDFVQTPPDIKEKKEKEKKAKSGNVRVPSTLACEDLPDPQYPIVAPHLQFGKFSWHDQVEQMKFQKETGRAPFTNMKHNKKVEWRRRCGQYFMKEGCLMKRVKTTENKRTACKSVSVKILE